MESNESKINEKLKIKPLGNIKIRNKIINAISYIKNELNFSNEDLEIEIKINSSSSSIDCLKYNLGIKNLTNNNPKIKFLNFQINDEYYIDDNKQLNIMPINLEPFFHKNMHIDLSSFPFYYYDIQNKNLEQFKEKIEHKNKFIICLYIYNFDKNLIDYIINYFTIILKDSDSFFKYFHIYILFRLVSGNIEQIFEKNELRKFLEDNKNNINLILNLSKVKNIFNKSFFPKENLIFILNLERQIVLKKKFENLQDYIHSFFSSLIYYHNDNKSNKNYNDYLKEKKNKKIREYEKMNEILSFISNINELNYIFKLEFNISFRAVLSNDSDKIIINKLDELNFGGELETKEYKYLTNLLSFEHQKNINISLKEIETIDVNIDFNEMKCFKCSKIITEDQYLYYCYICEAKYCCECVMNQIKNKGKQKFIDQKHNLLFFKTRNKDNFKNIIKERLGTNKFANYQNDNDFLNTFGASCNGCSYSIQNMPRYVCLLCRQGIYMPGGYVDYCQKCITIMNNDKDRREELESKAYEILSLNDYYLRNHKIKVEHKHNEHIYLFLPLVPNCGEYYKYY